MKKLVPLLLVLCGCVNGTAAAVETPLANTAAPTYADAVLASGPVAFWMLSAPHLGSEPSLVAGAPDAVYHGGVIRTSLPDGEEASVFDGWTGYVEIADSPLLSVPLDKPFTVEAWVRPDTVAFPVAEGAAGPDYVHWIGKGTAPRAEWVGRIYTQGNTEHRANRISAYGCNPQGGLCVGSYFQDDITPGEWLYIVITIDRSPAAITQATPLGITQIYRDGELRDQDSLRNPVNHDPPLEIVPVDGTDPMRIGANQAFGPGGVVRSRFRGGIGAVAIYHRRLSLEEQAAHMAAMIGAP